MKFSVTIEYGSGFIRTHEIQEAYNAIKAIEQAARLDWQDLGALSGHPVMIQVLPDRQYYESRALRVPFGERNDAGRN